MFSAPFLSTLLHRAKAVVRRVVGTAAARARGVPAGVAPETISGELRRTTRDWMRGKLRALSALTRRIEAGERPDLPVPSWREAAAGDVSKERRAVPAEARLPRGFGWMCAVEPTIRQAGAAFADWLSEPATQAKVLAAPQAMARAISPILHATGATPPDWFPVVGKRAKYPSRGGKSECGASIEGSGRVGDSICGFCEDAVCDLGSAGVIPPPTPPTGGGGVLITPAYVHNDLATKPFPLCGGRLGRLADNPGLYRVAVSMPARQRTKSTFSILKRIFSAIHPRAIRYDIETII
jgi:hypothetical protein